MNADLQLEHDCPLAVYGPRGLEDLDALCSLLTLETDDMNR